MTNAHVGNVVGCGAITPVLDRWKQGVADGDLSAIASAFTPDALFQGMKPTFTIGRDGIKQYYSAQAPGLTVEYQLLHLRQLVADAVVVYLSATFRKKRGDLLQTRITTILHYSEDGWLIDHYHVSALH
jgi:uncharacterized protein (TIGR02246 family)